MIALLLALSSLSLEQMGSNDLLLHKACRDGSTMVCAALAEAPSSVVQHPKAEKPADATIIVPFDKFADNLMADGFWIGMGVAADFATTSYALRHCSNCAEANELGPDVEARVALKAALYPAAIGICYVARRHGWNTFASGFRWGLTAALVGISVNNVIQGNR